MNHEPHDPAEMAQRLALLADAYLHGEITAEGLAEMEAIVHGDPDAARRFIDFIEQAGMMREVFGSATEQLIAIEDEDPDDFFSVLSALEESERRVGIVPVDLTDEFERRAQRRKRAARGSRSSSGRSGGWESVPPLAVVAAIAALFLFAFWLGGMMIGGGAANRPGQHAGPGQAPSAFAGRSRLLASHQAVWGAGGAPHRGQNLQDMSLELRSGLAQIEMGNGAALLVEGPARLRITGPGEVEFSHGKLTASTGQEGSSLLIQAPNATILDNGASFGVSVDQANQTTAQVFHGEVSLTPMTNGVVSASAISLLADQAVQVDASGQQTTTQPADLHRFVQPEVFDALVGQAGPVTYAEARRMMWEHDRELIAAMSFPVDAPWSAYGMSARAVEGGIVVSDGSLDSPYGQNPGLGGRMAIDQNQRTTLFLDLDLSSGSPARQAGLLRGDSDSICRDGTRVCIAYRMRLDRNPARDAAGWCGLSLFYNNDVRETGEFLFLGKIAHQPLWGTDQRRVGNRRVGTDDGAPVSLPDPADASVREGQVVQWLIVIDCLEGADRIAIYRDPAPGDLGRPALVLDDVDMRLDRLRVEASDGSQQWSLDEIRVGTTPRAVLQN